MTIPKLALTNGAPGVYFADHPNGQPYPAWIEMVYIYPDHRARTFYMNESGPPYDGPTTAVLDHPDSEHRRIWSAREYVYGGLDLIAAWMREVRAFEEEPDAR